MREMIKQIYQRYRKSMLDRLENQQATNAVLLGALNIQRIKSMGRVESLEAAEFKVFSQCGEDGIIQYLISRIPIPNKIFVEFGVENYTESNTRYLLINDNYSGLVIDGDKRYVEYIKNDPIYWRYELNAVCEFITKENINTIIEDNKICGDIGIMSIDLDGNDYWIWQSIEVVSPRIVVCEYNSILGADYALTVPYNKNFNRTHAHFSNLYFGASLKALCQLAEEKGYDFVGSNSSGSNAFFVRKDVSQGFRKFSVKEGYVISKIREARNEKGNLTYISKEDRIKTIANMDVVDINAKKIVKIKELI